MHIKSHICRLMNDFLEDKRMPIGYIPRFREYYFDLRYSPAMQGIKYCPWCGELLPEDLRDEYFDVLEKEYGISNPFDEYQSKNFPEEFKSDEWWKKRGL